jgi:hypothetical protein
MDKRAIDRHITREPDEPSPNEESGIAFSNADIDLIIELCEGVLHKPNFDPAHRHRVEMLLDYIGNQL